MALLERERRTLSDVERLGRPPTPPELPAPPRQEALPEPAHHEALPAPEPHAALPPHPPTPETPADAPAAPDADTSADTLRSRWEADPRDAADAGEPSDRNDDDS